MRLQTHVAGGVLAYTVTATFFQLPWTATGVVAASLAAAAPDVDTLGSTVGRLCAPVARRIERRFGHRTLTHCYLAQAAVAALAVPLAWGGLPHLYAAVVVGYASHPFLDTLTVQGVRVWWPWSDRRGVFPFYTRQPTAYRTSTGSRVDTAFGVAFVCLTVPFAIVQADGYQRLIRRVQADASAAVRDFLDWSADGYLVSVDVTASDPQHLRRLTGTFDAVGTTGANTLLVRDPDDGRLISLGPAYAADFQPDRVVARRGARVTVSRRRVDLRGRLLADLDGLVPRAEDGARVRHLLDGQVTVTEAAGVTPDAFHFDPVAGADRRLTLRFATLADLERHDITGLAVETGVVTVRVFVRDGEAEGYDPDRLGGVEVHRTAFVHKPSEPPRLLVAVGDTVAQGDTVAVLPSTALERLALDVADAQAALDAARDERVPSTYDPVALRQRVTRAEDAARRIDVRRAQGFASDAAAIAARAEVADLRDQLAAAEAREGDWRRQHAGRVRAASMRLRRAQHAHRAALREATVRATRSGVVRRIERHARGPDRAEVRVVVSTPPPPLPPSHHPGPRSEPLLP